MTNSEMERLLKTVETKTLTEEVEKTTHGCFAPLPSGRTRYEVKGEGEAVVLVHGYATPYYIYDKLFAALVESGFKVLRYDLLGRGFSERVKTDYTPDLFSRQLLEIVDYVFGHDEKFYLVGTSMGGTITATFASEYPDRVKKLILLAPAGMDTFMPPFYMKLCDIPGLGNFIFKNVAGKMLLKRCATELLYSTDDIDYYVRSFADAAQYKGFLDCTLSSLRKTILNTKYATEKYKIVGKTNIPVLAIWGTNDKTMPYYQSERLKEVLPNVRLITYENSGHIFVFDEGQRTADDVLKFIKE